MSRHICVIGGGVVGLSCAYYLQQRGFRVTVLERGSNHHDCCSLGNAGMVVPSHFEPLAAPGMVSYGLRMMLSRNSPFGLKPSLDLDLIRWAWLFARSCSAANVEKGSRLLRDLHMTSRSLYQELASECGNAFGLAECGLVMLCADQKTFDSERHLADRARKLDLQVSEISGRDIGNLESNLKITAAGAIHFLDDCYLNPQLLCAWLTQDLLAKGVDIRYGTQVTGFAKECDLVKAVGTSRGEIEADEFVVAAGAWSGALAKRLGFRMPMQGGKGYSSDVPVASPPKHCFILVEARIAVTPMQDRLRFAGTMEIVGDDLSVNPRRHQGILQSIPKYMPDFQPRDFEGTGVWSGLRPCSADGLPYLGRPKHLNNLIVSTGHSMMGVSLAPVSGQIVAELASQTELSVSLSAMQPDRFN